MHKKIRLAGVCIAWMLLPGWSGHTLARGSTGEEDALSANSIRRAPLALSANGQWRLHVGPDQVLQRVNLADPQQAQRIKLPMPAFTLSASRSGQRVAFTAPSECVGVVDFGSTPSAAPAITWWPSVAPLGKRDLDPAEALVPGKPRERECGQGQRLDESPVALSPDGRWLATPWQVIDLETRKTVATFANAGAQGRATVHLQFVDNGRRLLSITATLGEGYESPSTPSDLQFAVWDMAGRSLHRLLSMDDALLFFPQAFFFHHSAQTGALYWLDSRSYQRARAAGKPDAEQLPLELMQTRLTGCKASAIPRFSIPVWDWSSLLVDPQGRWVAGMRPLDTAAGAGRGSSGFVEELVVYDLDSRALVQRQAFRRPLHGLVALPDGSAIFGLTGRHIDRNTGVPAAGAVAGELVEVRIELEAVKTPKLAAAPWEGPCAIEDEVAGARQVNLEAGGPATPKWSLPFTPVTEQRRLAESSQEPPTEPPPAGSGPCAEGMVRMSHVMRDGSVWMDGLSEIAQLDPATGKTLRTLPTPRRPRVCSLPVPSANGFISYQGDTLSWRPFDASPARRTLEVKPGWYVTQVRLDEQGRIESTWMPKAGTVVPQAEGNAPLDVRMVTHDAMTLQRVREWADNSTSIEMGGGQFAPRDAVCERAGVRQRSGHDWRLSHYASLRAYACDGDKPRTVLWSHLDISPRDPGPTGQIRQAWAADGGVAVGQDGERLYVFDIGGRRVLKRIELAMGTQVDDVQLVASLGLVLVQVMTTEAGTGNPQYRLQAYAYR